MSTTEEVVWINGEYQSLSEASVPIEDRGYLFADGIYEVIAAYDGVPVLLEEHLDRWDRSAEGLRLPQAYNRQQRLEVIRELLDRLGASRATLYGQLTRGVARRAHQFPAEARPTEMWFARVLNSYPAAWYADGVKLITHPDERWARCWIKSTCLLPNCLAKQYAVERGAFDVIMHTPEGIVTESSAANAYCIKDGVIHTHPANGRILGGMKRAMVLNIARGMNIPVVEEPFTLDFLRGADEAFLTSTTLNALPFTSIDGAAIGSGKVGPVISSLIQGVESELQRRVAQGPDTIGVSEAV